MKNIFANTLSRTEKITISFFLALFIIPELLWSPVTNLIYAFLFANFFHSTNISPLFRDSFLYTQNFPNASGLVVLLVQSVALFFSFLFFS